MSRKNWVYTIIIVIVLIVGIFIYSNFNPTANSLFPKCIFLQLSGYKCPGCGSQRAIHALLNGDIVAAWKFNAMLFFAVPYIILLIVGKLLKTKYPPLRNTIESVPVIIGVFILIVSWWILRNIFGW